MIGSPRLPNNGNLSLLQLIVVDQQFVSHRF